MIFDPAYAAWQREPWWRHGAAVAILVLVLIARFPASIADPEPLWDELDYFRGFHSVARGDTPYADPAFLYPPVVAIVGAWGSERFGEGAVLVAIRGANLLGIATALWCSLAWLGRGWRWRVVGAAAIACLAPPIRLGILWGNLNLAVAGMVILGLLLWPKRPLIAGLLLGLSIAIKPLAPVAVLALLCHRPVDGGRRHWVAGGLALALSGVLILGFPHLEEMLARTSGDLVSGTVSLHRFPYLLGFDLSPFWLFSLVALATVWWVRRLPAMGPAHLLCFATTAALASSPLVWVHTLLLALPLQVLAVQLAWSRWGGGRQSATRDTSLWRRWEPAFVLLAVAAIQLAKGATAIAEAPLLIQWCAALPPALAPALLTLYLFRYRPSPNGHLAQARLQATAT